MALPQQLKTARITDATTASTLDNVLGTIEGVIADIFGFTVDVDITASPFSLNNAGQITKALVAQRAAGPVGWRMRDTTTGKEVRLAIVGTNFVIDENTGSEAAPAWTTRLSMVIATGALTGTAATTAAMGLCPMGSGVATEFLNGNLGWTVPSASAIPPSVRLRHSANQSLSTGSVVTLTFDTEDFDTDTMHTLGVSASKIVIVTAGKYLVIGQVTFAINDAGERLVQIVKNGTVISRNVQLAATLAHSMDARTIVDVAVGDYLQLQAYQSSGSTINATTAASYAPVFSACKIG